jgi:outer membrane protein OmpA-like peptidoglycan-associated protein
MLGRKARMSVVWLAALSMISGCTGTGMSEKEQCMLLGAGAGVLVGGGAAAGTVAVHGHRNQYTWAVPAGVVGGALIGGLAGYLLCPSPPPPPPPPPEKIILRGVHFDFDKYNIRPQDAAVLDEAAEILKSHPNITVNVNGYCDAIGTVRYNLKLSERRAEAVVKYLVDHGIAESRLIPHGYGKTNFVATNKTAEGRAQNRRVELVPVQ